MNASYKIKKTKDALTCKWKRPRWKQKKFCVYNSDTCKEMRDKLIVATIYDATMIHGEFSGFAIS